jgi:hypothetical protein
MYYASGRAQRQSASLPASDVEREALITLSVATWKWRSRSQGSGSYQEDALAGTCAPDLILGQQRWNLAPERANTYFVDVSMRYIDTT